MHRTRKILTLDLLTFHVRCDTWRLAFAIMPLSTFLTRADVERASCCHIAFSVGEDTSRSGWDMNTVEVARKFRIGGISQSLSPTSQTPTLS